MIILVEKLTQSHSARNWDNQGTNLGLPDNRAYVLGEIIERT